MCEGSIHVAHRLATDKEELVVKNIGSHGIKGFYPANPAPTAGSKLVCVRGVKEIIIHEVKFDRHYVNANSNPQLVELIGQKNVTATFTHISYGDTITFKNGVKIHLSWLAIGTRVDLGIPAITGKPGMKKLKAAIDEGIATEPTPAPEPKPEAAPAPEKAPDEPVKEPEEEKKTTARRRRSVKA
jgi:hypothetical protein